MVLEITDQCRPCSVQKASTPDTSTRSCASGTIPRYDPAILQGWIIKIFIIFELSRFRSHLNSKDKRLSSWEETQIFGNDFDANCQFSISCRLIHDNGQIWWSILCNVVRDENCGLIFIWCSKSVAKYYEPEQSLLWSHHHHSNNTLESYQTIWQRFLSRPHEEATQALDQKAQEKRMDGYIARWSGFWFNPNCPNHGVRRWLVLEDGDATYSRHDCSVPS